MACAAEVEPVRPPVPRGFGSWLRPEDAAVAMEDAEHNVEQAARNAKMRDMLRQRREQAQAATAAAAEGGIPAADAQQLLLLEDFMSVQPDGDAGGATASSARSRVHAERGRSPPPWFVARPDLPNAVLRLHEELLDFAAFMGHSAAETRARKLWVRTIRTACQQLWPECKVQVFGSFATGLSLPNGDVDVAVLGVGEGPGQAMKMLANLLLESGEISWLEIIESAKVPVVKVRAQASGLRADVVFNQPDGLETSRFIRERCQEYPQMRPLLVFLKYFLLQRGLHETYTGGMGSYLLCNVVLHFLQRHPSKRHPRQYAATSLGHLLFDFMRYYGQEFKYESHGISVLDGGFTFDKAQRGWRNGNRRGSASAQLCLESPLGPPSDLGAPCFRMAVLRNLFQHALHCLSHLFVSQAGPQASMLCPLLLDPAHPVIAARNRLLSEQPVALPGLPKGGRAKGDGHFTPEDEDGSEHEAGGAPVAKRRRRNGGVANEPGARAGAG